MITTLTRKDNPEIFEILDEDWYPIDEEQEHRRGSTFYTDWYIEINSDVLPNNPELYGFWKTNNFVWSDIDYDKKDITELYRVKKVKRVIETEEWVLVENV